MNKSYLRIRNWKNYQNADVFKKSHGKPPWIKLYVWLLDDYELRSLPYATQLVFDRLLLVAAKQRGAIPNDSEWLAAQTGIDAQTIAESVALLLKGRWLSQTKTPRRSREILERVAKDSPLDVDRDREKERAASSSSVPPYLATTDGAAEQLDQAEHNRVRSLAAASLRSVDAALGTVA